MNEERRKDRRQEGDPEHTKDTESKELEQKDEERKKSGLSRLPSLSEREELAKGIEKRARERGVWKKAKRSVKDLLESDPALVRKALGTLGRILLKAIADTDVPDDDG